MRGGFYFIMHDIKKTFLVRFPYSALMMILAPISSKKVEDWKWESFFFRLSWTSKTGFDLIHVPIKETKGGKSKPSRLTA